MPASRSRTTEWRRSLEQLRAREGAIEIAVAHDHPGGDEAILRASDLVWRVRVLDLANDEVSVDLPFALGRAIELPQGTELVAAIAIGQNRWMFRCKVKGAWAPKPPFPRTHRGIRLTLPDHVERCLRRSTRVDVGSINPPSVEMWPLLEPRSAMPAERASELAFRAAMAGEAPGRQSDDLLPTVGPGIKASLVNLGGGGLGVLVDHADASALSRHRMFWIRFTLGSVMPVPVCATARVVHTHMDSSQRVYAGISFDFDFNPAHQRVVAEQIVHAIGRLTGAQRRAA
jgi:Flagellar protein YcgR